MNFSIVATKNKSVLRYEHREESYGNIDNLEIFTHNETPTLRYEFDDKKITLSSGTFTAELVELVETIKTILNYFELEDILDSLTGNSWEIHYKQ